MRAGTWPRRRVDLIRLTETTSGHRLIARKRLISLTAPSPVLAYLAYAAVSFDLAGLPGWARWDNGALILQDFWSYKVRVTRGNRRGEIAVSVEGMRNATFRQRNEPDRINPRPMPDGGSPCRRATAWISRLTVW